MRLQGHATGRMGIVGLGNLGHAMATALLNAGRSLVVHDTHRPRAEDLVSLGATVANTLEGLASCPLILLAVPDDAAVMDVVTTLSEVATQPCIFVVHSTVLPATPQFLAGHCTARGHILVDAPVSGGAERAQNGDLTLMVGASESAYRAVRPTLELLAAEVWYMGEPGAGAAAKLANQLMMFASLAGVQEALRITDAFGIDQTRMLEMTRSSTSACWVADHWGFFEALATEYDSLGTPVTKRPWSKDLFDVMVTAREVGEQLPVAALLSQLSATRVETAAARWRSRQRGA